MLIAVAGTAFAGLAALPASAAGTGAGTGSSSAVALDEAAQGTGELDGGAAAAGSSSEPAAGAADAALQPPAHEEQQVEPPVEQLVNVALGTALAQGLEVANRPPPPPLARASRDRTDPATGEPVSFTRPGTGRLTSQYGRRWGRLHGGIDLAAGVGAPVVAVTDGTVTSAGSEGGYGLTVRLLHDDGAVSVYAHLSQLLVSAGERVQTGQQVGAEGNTGHSTGPHLHFEIRVEGTPVDPRAWLRERGVEL